MDRFVEDLKSWSDYAMFDFVLRKYKKLMIVTPKVPNLKTFENSRFKILRIKLEFFTYLPQRHFSKYVYDIFIFMSYLSLCQKGSLVPLEFQ